MDGADGVLDLAGRDPLKAGATPLRDAQLTDRYDIAKSEVLLSGVQALIRLPIAQKERDRVQGLRTAGYVTGYRGSPLGGVDMAAARAQGALSAAEVRFQPGLNEDLAATAVWGAQQATLRGRSPHDGVFALWYGKGPGLDRSGDVFRHGNLAGAHVHGGVLVAMGDDHTCESSTSCHQTDVTLMDAHIPVLHPAGPQEILDYGLLGWGMSRFTGCWVGLKCLKDTVEATTVVDGDPHRLGIRLPEAPTPPQGLNIQLGESPQDQEARLIEWRLPAVAEFARVNGFDARRIGRRGARIGVAASGKSWLDVRQALDFLGVDDARAQALGLTAYKVGMAWPLDGVALRDFAHGLELLIVVEEKRSFIESQAKEALYALPDRPVIIGKRDADGAPLFPQKMDLAPLDIARGLARQILAIAPEARDLRERLAELEARASDGAPADIAARPPYFCSGCPHNTSTKTPDGARAAAGIGCHYMVQWMDRETTGFTHMGGEGAQWIGEAPFTSETHLFQNIGDGTYNHSGLMAIRAAIAADVNITYKVLYNDAVAMTGGQNNDGDLTPYKVAAELVAAGVKKLAVVYDPKEKIDRWGFPAGVQVAPRARLDAIQREMAAIKGVTAILYIQTCAAEKRRRRKRKQFPDIDARVMINDLVCEGCGDCGQVSNCVSILPKETAFGRKREIDQSSCNKDFACTDGFCPSFVTVKGARPKKRAAAELDLPHLPEPVPPAIRGDHALLVTGVGGTGVVTVGAVLGMAAHLEEKGVGVMEMAGLAQKGGPVLIHCRIGETPAHVTGIRVQPGEAHGVIGGDLVVSAGTKALGAMAKGRTGAVVNDFEIVTGDFTRDVDFRLPSAGLRSRIEERVGADAATFLNATKLAETLLGDAIFANMLMLGAAWQRGLVPLGRDALRRAIQLNGAAVDGNLKAFEIGRWAVVDPTAAAARVADDAAPIEETLDDLIARRAAFLTAYQNTAWSERYLDAVGRIRGAEQAVRPGADALTRAAAKSLFKLMSYKDEYEVARLHAETTETLAAEKFDGVRGFEFHLAPPLIAPKGADGRPRKIKFGGWMLGAFKLLRRGKALRGTPFDPFGLTEERRMERRLIDTFEAELSELAQDLSPARHALAVQIAELPMAIRGFGHVKAQNAADVAARRASLWATFRLGDGAQTPGGSLAAE